MKCHRSPSGFGRGVFVGLLAGLVLGSSAMVLASPRAEDWARFTEDFRFGYVFGFIDMANLARNLDPGGYVDERYPLWPKVQPTEWKALVDELYRNPENHQYSLYGILQLAAVHLERKHGPAPSVLDRIKPQLSGLLKSAEERRAAAAKAEGKPDPGSAKAPTKDADKAGAKTAADTGVKAADQSTPGHSAPAESGWQSPWEKRRKKRCACPEEAKPADSTEAPKSPPAPAGAK